MKPILKLGQTLYSLNVGNACRNNEQKLTPGKVVKIGRKYFEFQFEDYHRPMVFHLDNWCEKTEYSSCYVLYESPQAWEDEKKSNEICELIHKSFEYGNNVNHVPLENLIKIVELILKKEK